MLLVSRIFASARCRRIGRKRLFRRWEANSWRLVSPYVRTYVRVGTQKRRSAYVAYYLQLAAIYVSAPDEAGHGECGKREREDGRRERETRTAALPANSRRPAIFTRTIKQRARPRILPRKYQLMEIQSSISACLAAYLSTQRVPQLSSPFLPSVSGQFSFTSLVIARILHGKIIFTTSSPLSTNPFHYSIF